MGRSWDFSPVHSPSYLEQKLVPEPVSWKIFGNAVLYARYRHTSFCSHVQHDVQRDYFVPICILFSANSRFDADCQNASHGRRILEFCIDDIPSGSALEYDDPTD